jgi:hypothetical protein
MIAIFPKWEHRFQSKDFSFYFFSRLYSYFRSKVSTRSPKRKWKSRQNKEPFFLALDAKILNPASFPNPEYGYVCPWWVSCR